MGTTLLAALKVRLFRHTRHTNQETEPPSIIHTAASHRNQGNLQLELSLIALRFPAGSLDRHNQHVRVGSFCHPAIEY